MIRLIIFDLDNCVFDTRGMGPGVIAKLIRLLDDSTLTSEVKQRFKEMLYTTALDDIIKALHVPNELAHALKETFKTMTVPKQSVLKTYGDEVHIDGLQAAKVLVTSGYRAFQQSKIDRLKIGHLFDQTIIDSIDDSAARKGKRKIFGELAMHYACSPHEIMVVGDNPLSELKAGKELGMITVQTLRPGVSLWKSADHHIHSFAELKELMA